MPTPGDSSHGESPRESGRALGAVFAVGAFVVCGAMALSRSGLMPAHVQLLDNIHWTLAYVTGAVLAWIGVRAATGAVRAARWWFAVGLTGYAFGQVLWDIQVAIDWNPFPGPSDIFFLTVGLSLWTGLWRAVARDSTREQRRNILLDFAALGAAVLALVLTLYLPRQGGLGSGPMVFLVAYPVLLLGALCLGIVVVLTLRVRSLWLFLACVLADGALWMEWNLRTLEDRLDDGSWYNFGFSITALLLGLSVARWRLERWTSPRAERRCEFVLRLLPLLLVLLVAACIVVVATGSRLSTVAKGTIGVGGALVVVLASLRQRALLAERDRLLEAEQQARHHEGRFRALFSSNLQGVFLTGMTGRITLANDAFLRMVGYSQADLAAGLVDWSRMTPEDHRARDLAALHELETTGRALPWEKEYLRKDGSRVAVIVGAARLEPGGDELVAFALDVSALKEAERATENSLALMRATLESSLDGILVVRRDGTVETCNQRFLAMWPAGTDARQLRDGNEVLDLIGRQLRTSVEFTRQRERLQANPEGESAGRFEHGDGRILEIYSRPQLVHDRVEGRVWIFRDVTERQNLEQQLRQAQKMEAVGQLAGGIAHDFNNLLTAIMGNAGLLRLEPGLPPGAVDAAREIVEAGTRAAGLTRQLLAFGRRHVLNISALNLNDVVLRTDVILQRLLGEDVAVEVALASQPLWIRGDPALLEQVLINFCLNSRDAMPEGGHIWIATSWRRRLPATGEGTEERDFAVLEVVDTGTGIAPEHLPKIFEPFFTTKDVGKGSGLGLAMVFGIVQQHGGWIEVESPPAGGATFRVFLPLSAAVSETSPAPAPAESVSSGRGEVILVVEDDRAVRVIAERALTGQGYRVLVAADGVSAREVWARHRDDIAVLLTDIVMPGGVTGIALARALQAERPALRVIYTSGYDRSLGDSRDALREGVNFLAKPYLLGALYRLIRERLDSPADPSLTV